MPSGPAGGVAATQTWHVRTASRVLLVGFSLGMLGVCAVLVIDDQTILSDPVFWAFVAAFTVAFPLAAFRPLLRLEAHQLTYRNLLRSRSIPRTDVIGATAGYFGLTVESLKGNAVCIVAQTSNIAAVTSTTTRADKIAAAINKWAKDQA